jgi:hypothetical protein
VVKDWLENGYTILEAVFEGRHMSDVARSIVPVERGGARAGARGLFRRVQDCAA